VAQLYLEQREALEFPLASKRLVPVGGS
jgi:hypothetical protein